MAALLRSLTVGGVALVEHTPAEQTPPFCNGIVLAPWPNRVRDARWTLDGEQQQLDLTEPARGGALHGLLQFTDYEVPRSGPGCGDARRVHRRPSTAGRSPSTPGCVRARAATGSRSRTASRNRRATPAPWAVGTHPVPAGRRRPGRAAHAHRARRHATSRSTSDSIRRPSRRSTARRRSPRGPGSSAHSPSTPPTARSSTPTRPTAAATARGCDAPDGARTTLWQDLDWGYLQVFTTTIFPRADGARATPSPSSR